MSKELFDAADVDETSEDFKSITSEHDKKFWLFRQGFFYGSGLFAISIIQIAFNIDWCWSQFWFTFYGIGIFASLLKQLGPIEIVFDFAFV